MSGGGSDELVVVGAGPAGLTAAWRAALAGYGVTVLEAGRAVGGMAASIEVAGQRVDLGSHRLHPAATAHVLAAVRQLLGDDLQERPRNGRIHLGGRWVRFPFEPADLARNLPRSLALGIARDMATRPLRRPRADTFAEVIRAGLGPTVLREFYGPYARKLWDAAPEDLDGELARRRVSAGGPAALLARLRPGASGRGRTFLYPRLGYGQIVEALAHAAVDAGATIRLGSPVSGIDLAAGTGAGSGVRLTVDGERIDAGHVLWTAPLGALVRAARPAAPAPVRSAVERLRHRGAALVYLVVDRPQWTPFDAHYVPDADVPVARLSEPKNYRDGPDPAGRTVLCAELPCWPGDAIWKAAPEELGELVRDSLVRCGLPDPSPVDVVVHRLPHVYPVYRPGFAASFRAVEEWTAAQRELTLLGRQATFVPDNLHHVMAMGWDAAASLRPGPTFDEGSWRRARARHARHVVED